MTTPDELERAVDRLEKAMKIADQYAAGVWFGEGNDGFVSFATILAILSERAELLAAVERMRGALEKIERWHGEFPSEDWVNDDGFCTPAPYGVRYGSNGERDFMRGVARAALTTGEANHKDKP